MLADREAIEGHASIAMTEREVEDLRRLAAKEGYRADGIEKALTKAKLKAPTAAPPAATPARRNEDHAALIVARLLAEDAVREDGAPTARPPARASRTHTKLESERPVSGGQ